MENLIKKSLLTLMLVGGLQVAAPDTKQFVVGMAVRQTEEEIAAEAEYEESTGNPAPLHPPFSHQYDMNETPDAAARRKLAEQKKSVFLRGNNKIFTAKVIQFYTVVTVVTGVALGWRNCSFLSNLGKSALKWTAVGTASVLKGLAKGFEGAAQRC